MCFPLVKRDLQCYDSGKCVTSNVLSPLMILLMLLWTPKISSIMYFSITVKLCKGVKLAFQTFLIKCMFKSSISLLIEKFMHFDDFMPIYALKSDPTNFTLLPLSRLYSVIEIGIYFHVNVVNFLFCTISNVLFTISRFFFLSLKFPTSVLAPFPSRASLHIHNLSWCEGFPIVFHTLLFTPSTILLVSKQSSGLQL